mgnify:CR=1 FL=1
MASLSLEGIQKVYSNGFQAVKDFNLKSLTKSSSSSLVLPDVENQQHFV